MEEILKLIKKISLLIPFLIIFFHIKPVYAENRYIWTNKWGSNFSSSIYCSTVFGGNYNTQMNHFHILDNDYYIGVGADATTTTNSVLLKHKPTGLYYVINYRKRSDSQYVNLDSHGLHYFDLDTSTNLSINVFTFNYIINEESDKLSYISDLFYFYNHPSWTIGKSCDMFSSNQYLYINVDTPNAGAAQAPYLIIYYNLKDFEYIDSSVDFYVDKKIFNGYDEEENNNNNNNSNNNIPYLFNNNKYYVPNYHDGQCVEVLDKDTIRVFEDEFTSFYIDYYINSNYISKQGQVEVDYEKHCSTLDFTDIRYYGNDFPKILFILICFLTFTLGFPYVLYKRFRKK